MRTTFVALLLAFVIGCQEPNADIAPVTVHWMDWPAEVKAGQPFRTRLVIDGVCALNPRFNPGARADQSAVTFEPYFQVDKERIACTALVNSLVVIGIDTAGLAPALAAAADRTYQMRAVVPGDPAANTAPGIPVRTFGDVLVRAGSADASRRNAAGLVQAQRDQVGCVRVRPYGAYRPDAPLVLEDQADTVGLAFAFVRGYIYDSATPVCGETHLFHLVSRN